VRREALKVVGLLDEQFFMYAEDLDWCKRFREAGYQIIYHPQVKIIHHKNKSGIKSVSQSIARKTKLHFYNTMLQYYDKHYSNKYPPLVRQVIRYFIVIKKGAL
jgi:GT2 family glycosyltransferase